MPGTPAPVSPAPQRRAVGLIWLALALVACLSVTILNGRPLFYYDTRGYIDQGTTGLTHLRLIPRNEVHQAPITQSQREAGDVAAPVTGNRTVDGSRSASYALLAALLAHLHALWTIPLVNAMLTMLAVWLPMRVAQRIYAPDYSVAVLVALPVIAACAGSLPFYVAFLMPDIFSPIMVLMIATLTVFGRQMTAGERMLALVLGTLAIVSHLSHLAIGAVLLPLSVLVSLGMSRRRWWLPPLLVAVIIGMGYTEKIALRLAAEKVSHSEVILKPFLTARLIQDGPGLDYLTRHCPDAAIATCPLLAALQLSTDPMRLTASHIIFETSATLGSFRLMSSDNQDIVARNQFKFFRDVLLDDPVGVTYAVVRNTLIQARMFSVDMTLQTDKMVDLARDTASNSTQILQHGRLTRAIGWLAPATALQTGAYMLAFLSIIVLGLLPHRVPGPIRLLVLMLLAGLLANALICGAVSQPATRYGARVSWLLPLAAVILAMFSKRNAVGRGAKP